MPIALDDDDAAKSSVIETALAEYSAEYSAPSSELSIAAPLKVRPPFPAFETVAPQSVAVDVLNFVAKSLLFLVIP